MIVLTYLGIIAFLVTYYITFRNGILGFVWLHPVQPRMVELHFLKRETLLFKSSNFTKIRRAYLTVCKTLVFALIRGDKTFNKVMALSDPLGSRYLRCHAISLMGTRFVPLLTT